MRTTPLPALLLLSTLAGCGGGPPAITVGGQTLVIRDKNFGQAAPGYFCQSLANGQYQVMITDFALCDKLKGMNPNPLAFHSTDESNVRIIFSNALKVPPIPNKFTVATNPGCKDGSGNPNGAEAVFIFSHNTMGKASYDAEIQAESGSITVETAPDMIKTKNELKLSYDVTIMGTHLTGEVDALGCAGITPGIGL